MIIDLEQKASSLLRGLLGNGNFTDAQVMYLVFQLDQLLKVTKQYEYTAKNPEWEVL